MSVSFSAGSIENLKSRVDIVDVIGQVVPLKRAGSNYKGLCPFHGEKTPSFMVSESRQYFTCFGCGAKGDVIEFVKRYYNMDFVEAVEKLARDYGVTMETRSYDDHRGEYYEINRMAARFFYDAFTKKANRGYSYMEGRGIAPATLKKFGIGYADGEWDSLYRFMVSQGVEVKKLQELGLVSTGKGKCYDRFRNRVMFPIINTSGKVIGFGGRAVSPEDSPKYLNSPESRIFQKKNNLYGLNISRKAAGDEGFLILVEGYMDVIALYQSGVHNVAASLGTALTENQARLIHRYTKEVVLSYDADRAGRAAALRGIEILRKEGSKVKVLHVTDGKDPDEYVKKNGRDAFLELVGNALSYGEYKLESAKLGYDLSIDEDRLDYMKKAVEIIAAMSPLEQEIYKKKMAGDLGVAESAIDRELALREDRRASQTAEAGRKTRREEDAPEEREEISPLEKTLLKLVLTDDDYLPRLAEETEVELSLPARNILGQALREKKRRPDSVLDVAQLIEGLPEPEGRALQQLMEEILLDPEHEKVYEECLRTARSEKLAKREQELLTMLSMADEGGSQEQIRQMTDELMRIQRERKNLR